MNQLKTDILAAFPDSILLSHADCEELRTKLVSLDGEDVKIVLGPILIDVLDEYCNKTHLPLWADSVVRFLGSATPPVIEITENLRIDVKQFHDFSESRKFEMNSLFSGFSNSQSVVIYQWLKVIKACEESGVVESELECALAYWHSKCNEI